VDKNIIIQLSYLVASILFILGIKMLGKPATARRGNTYSAVAMFIAVMATLLIQGVLSYTEIFVAILIGSAIGYYYAAKVEMTQMPEMVALFNGFGGAASVLVAGSEYWRISNEAHLQLNIVDGITIVLSIIIGAITFTGSVVAWAKLNGTISGKAIVYSGQHIINLLLFAIAVVASVLQIIYPDNDLYFFIIIAIALVLGILVVIPIGGADMPVVVSLLNSYSGIAACFTGFVLNNQVLIIAGALVGTSGIILTQIMCKAMNRSLINVLLGGFGQTSSSAPTTGKSDIQVKEVGVEEAAIIFDSASSVIIVPGYGMAVAQAQHAVREFADLLEKKGINVRFAIHPVAGRMPGHMNVLLAEANISYDKLIEMDMINNDFANTDVCLIIGANDVVNPAARNDASSPIYGMPILNADKSRTVIVLKRGMSAGYAGVENELFGYDNCLMLFGDAKSSVEKLVSEIKEL